MNQLKIKELKRKNEWDHDWMQNLDYRKKRSSLITGKPIEEITKFTHKSPHHYKRIGVFINGVEKNYTEHKLNWILYTGNWPLRNEHIHHIDGDKTNNDILNLAKLYISDHIGYHKKYKDDLNLYSLLEYLINQNKTSKEIRKMVPALNPKIIRKVEKKNALFTREISGDQS